MLYGIVTLLILILDQGVKLLTTRNLEIGEVMEFIPGVIQFRYVQNFGAAFGLFSDLDFRWIIVAITAVFAIAVILALRNDWIHGQFGRWTAVMILGGALGNIIDRIIHDGGFVVDTFEFAFKIFGNTFPVFNVADIFVTVGGVLFCLYIIFHKEPELISEGRPKHAASEDGGESAPTQERKARIATTEKPADNVRPIREIQAKPSQAPRRKPQTANPAAEVKPDARQEAAAASAKKPEPKPASDIDAISLFEEEVRASRSPTIPPDLKPKTSSDSFDLDDILAEFRD